MIPALRGMDGFFAGSVAPFLDQILPFVQMGHNTAYNSTLHETPYYFMFGRMPTLPIGVIMGMPDIPESALQYTHKTVKNLQFACELSRQNTSERADAQAASNAALWYQQSQRADLVLVHQTT